MDSRPTAPGPYQYMLNVPNMVSVIGELPQEFALGVTSTWEGNATGSTIGDLAQNKFGSAGKLWADSAGVSSIGIDTLANRQWAGTSPLTFNLLGNFVARTDAIADVLVPILKLQSMCMPTKLLAIEAGKFGLGNVFGAPFFDTVGGGQIGGRSLIELHIGTMFVFEDMVVESVVPSYSTRLTSAGIPIHAQVEIQVSTRHIFTFENLLDSIINQAIIAADPYLSSAKATGGGSRAGALPTAPVE